MDTKRKETPQTQAAHAPSTRTDDTSIKQAGSKMKIRNSYPVSGWSGGLMLHHNMLVRCVCHVSGGLLLLKFRSHEPPTHVAYLAVVQPSGAENGF